MTTIQSLTSSTEALAGHINQKLPGTEAARFSRLLETLTADLQVAPSQQAFLVSAPGRTELAGNHTDHNHGRVLAASVQLDTIAAVAPRDDLHVTFASQGFPRVELELSDLEPRDDERETTAALVRGVAAAIHEAGGMVGGFDAAASSRVGAGSGLSSSASIEVLIGTILDHAWNSDRIGSTRVAIAGQIAENRYFGKPSGLMDQVACATGGVVAIDFKDNDNPVIERLEVSFTDAGLSLLVVDSGANHADLTDEYAAIPAEMRAIAAHLGVPVLADTTQDAVLSELKTLRSAVGDRAVARALHFFGETERVGRMVAALKNKDLESYLRLMADSGRSSGMFLQNCAPASEPTDQAVVIALALTEQFMGSAGLRIGRDAACRVHGGGFAGTIQVLLPTEKASSYREFIEKILGFHAATELAIRSTGAVAW
jgi:galactokinase